MGEKTSNTLITGAAGFLGSWIIARALAKGLAVVASDIDPQSHRLAQLVPPETAAGLPWHQCDITDTEAVDAMVEATQPSSIIHLGALTIPACRANPVLAAQVNVVGHVNVLEAARRHGVERIIYTSTIAAKPRGPANAPANLYGVLKKTDEEIARIFWEEYGLASLGLRPHIVYGVGRDDGETAAITEAIRAAAFGEAYEMPFSTRSCFQYAGDVADIFIRCLDKQWKSATVTDLTIEIESTDDVLSAIRAAAPDANIKPSPVERPSPQTGLDNSGLTKIIGPWKRTSLQDGIAKTYEMFREIGARSQGRSASLSS